MKTFAFNTAVENQLDTCKDVLISKSEEYSTSVDRLHNFKVAAAMQGISHKQALAGMMSKHTVSIFDMINEDADGIKFEDEQWSEKITDHINYLLLLRAMVTDEGHLGEDESLEDLRKKLQGEVSQGKRSVNSARSEMGYEPAEETGDELDVVRTKARDLNLHYTEFKDN